MIYIMDEVMELGKDLPTLYCNSFSCMGTELKFLQRELFIKLFLIKYPETD